MPDNTKFVVLECLRCGHKWNRIDPGFPRACVKCKNCYWNRPRRNLLEIEIETENSKISLFALRALVAPEKTGISQSLREVQKPILELSPKKSREIELTKGKIALVDEEDYPWLSQFNWNTETHGENWMAKRRKPNSKTGEALYMHRIITGAERGTFVDHRNGKEWDNRRENLRLCTRQQNMRNIAARRSKSGFKGVQWSKWNALNPWRSGIWVDSVHIHLGCYQTAEEAARAYNIAAIEVFGEFANLNLLEKA